tara:strand:- start:7110 stop:9152 length:2043 start_codon:yes stop_codon:yes gene_type:complete
MKPATIRFWKKEREIVKKAMKPHHELWKRLLKAYRMEFENLGIPEEEIVKISRFYPLARQIMASITFNYPRIFMRVEEEKNELPAEVYERTANAFLECAKVMPEVRQATFDALFCMAGWLKVGYNPKGDDAIAPYVANDVMADDMPYVRRCSPFDIYPDPLTPPTGIGYARYIMEEMLVPLEFVREDPRYVNRNKIRPIEKEDKEEILLDLDENPTATEEESEAIKESIHNGRMALLIEVHDRVHRKRYTFNQGLDEPIEEIDHPFLATEATKDAEGNLLGEFKKTGGFFVEDGFPYIPIRFDMTDEKFYGLPPMAYVEDEQNVIVESVSRRTDLLKRDARIILGSRREQERNADVADAISEGKDGTMAWVEDVNSSFRLMDSGPPPMDQIGIERDMRNYEEQVLQVSQMALGGGPRRTATEASLVASFGQLNREWMQAQVAEAYRKIIHNALRMMADERYTPELFLINVAQGENDPVYEAIKADWFKVRFKIDVEAGSMQPLVEQLERQDTLNLAQWLVQFPEVNRSSIIKMLGRTFRVPNMEDLIGETDNAEAQRAAHNENVLLSQGQNPGVFPGQNHQLHIQVHVEAAQQLSQQPGNPQQNKQFAQIILEHAQEHQQMLQSMATGGGQTAAQPNEMGGGIGGPSGDSPIEEVANTVSEVRSNAQTISQNVSRNPGQN